MHSHLCGIDQKSTAVGVRAPNRQITSSAIFLPCDFVGSGTTVIETLLLSSKEILFLKAPPVKMRKTKRKAPQTRTPEIRIFYELQNT